MDAWLVFIFTAPVATFAVCFTAMLILEWKQRADGGVATEKDEWTDEVIRCVQYGLMFPLTWLIALVWLGIALSEWRTKRAAQKADR